MSNASTNRRHWTPRQLRLFAAFGADLQERGFWGFADYASCHGDAMRAEERALDAAGHARIGGQQLARVEAGGRQWLGVEPTGGVS